MCDEHSFTDDARRGDVSLLTRAAAAETAGTTPLTESEVRVPAPDGEIDALLVHPERGRHPAVIFWPDAFGLREAPRIMARRLAAAGYTVLLANPYYRVQHGPIGLTFADLAQPEGRARLGELMPALTPEAIARDAAALVAFLDAQPATDTARGIGVQGYCFSGDFAFRAAATVPARIRAVATFHAGRLVTDQPDSPHRLFGQTQAAFLIAAARNDDAVAPTDKDTLREAADAAGRAAEIEVYGGNHGWCVPDMPSYDQPEADRAFARNLALYAGL
jgi:carboxymethylenebutenolidase